MLLPSALSCGYTALQQPEAQRQRPSRPGLPSFERYDPCQRSHSPVYGLIASCRALQSMLGDRFASSPSPSPSPSIDATLRAGLMASPFGEPTPPPEQLPAPRGSNKRRRDTFDDEIEAQQMRHETRAETHRTLYATPKRRRIIPLEMPPGLLASDFEALTDSCLPTIRTPVPSYPPRVELPKLHDISPLPEPQCSVSSWTENDDRLLVETVLSKLNLSTQEWNDCAQRLGKDKDSLGHRWRLLLGEGNIGLRRGIGRMSRADLDIKSWQ